MRGFKYTVSLGFSAINAKALKVDFNKAAEVAAADFTVTKGTVKANVANVIIAEDKKSAAIELSSKLTEGEYKVAVAQEGKDAVTGTVTVENEKVAEIKVVSTEAVFVKGSTAQATAKVEIHNQYGEDITKLNTSGVTLTASGIATTAGSSLGTDGKLTLALNAGAKVGDNAIVTLVHAATGTVANATLPLVSEAGIAEISIGSVYNKDGKALTQDVDFAKDKFYLPVTFKDQYGVDIKKAADVNPDIQITNGNPAVATIGTNVVEVTIDGKETLAIEISAVNQKGTANVLVVGTKTGAQAQGTVTVTEGLTISNVVVSAPTELVTAGKDAHFPVTIIDSNGNEIKTEKAHNALKNDKATDAGGYGIKEVKGKEGLFVTVPGGTITKDKAVTVLVTTTSGKSSTQTVVAIAAAEPTVITGLSDKVVTAIMSNNTTGVDIKNTELVVEDQYGQVITDATALAAVNFEVTAPDAATFTLTNTTYTSWNVKPVAAATKASEKLTFKLYVGGAAVEASAFTKTFTIVKDAQFVSYTVEDLKPIYAKASDSKVVAAYNKQAVVVKAKTASGAEVKLDGTKDFSVLNKPADGVVINFAPNATEAKVTMTVVINATGEEITKELTYSNVAPKVAKVYVVKDFTTAGKIVAGTEKVEELKTADYASAAKFDSTALYGVASIVVEDTYGIKVAVASATDLGVILADASAKITPTLTITKVSGDLIFKDNGQATAEVSEFTKDAEFNVVVKYNGVAAENPLKVKATSKFTPTADKAADDAAIAASVSALATPTVAADGSNLGTLPAADAVNGTTIAWTSSNTAVLGDDGAVATAAAGDVTLTAAISKGTGTTVNVTFTVTLDATKITKIVRD